jgi:CarD family transcriptional regulator, regulator of rRNA transcription
VVYIFYQSETSDMVRKTTPSKSAPKKVGVKKQAALKGSARASSSAAKAAAHKGPTAKSQAKRAAPAKPSSAKPDQAKKPLAKKLAQPMKVQAAKAASKPAAAKAPAATPRPAQAPAKVLLPKAVALKAAMVAGRPGGQAEVRRMPAAMAKHPGQAITAPPAVKAVVDKAAAARQQAAANKKPVSQRHGFKTNEWIVYPAHGVGRIVGIEEQEIAGMSLELFVITFEKDKMTLRVPTGKSASVGMRKLAEEGVVKRAMETLKGRARIKRTMWSRRAQEYEAKINSGDLIAIAEVVRDLYRSESQPEQSYSERQLYEAALDRMAREIAAVDKLDERGAVQRITEVLAKSAKGRRLAAEEAEVKAA